MTRSVAIAARAHTETTLHERIPREDIPTGECFRTRTGAAARSTSPALTDAQRLRNQQLILDGAYRTPTSARPAPSSQVRALSVRPPWSDCIAADGMRVVGLSWTTPWRGTLLIHAAITIDAAARQHPLVANTLPASRRLVRGAVVAVADLVDCHDDDGPCTPWSTAGSHHWVLRNVEALTTPLAVSGNAWLWTPRQYLLERIADAQPALRSRLDL